jgi:UDP-2,4-diacetamido-2,4,6-trideoxy-beta-L-altropyranose hydrolase
MLASRSLPLELERQAGAQFARLEPIPDDVTLAGEPHYLARRIGRVDLCITDHYEITGPWHQAVSGWAGNVAAIDDLAAAPQAVDVLLNQNLGVEPVDYRGLVSESTRLLLGPRFALVRPEFANERARARTRDGEIRRVLVFMSGADPFDTTRRAASAASSIGVAVDVVVGPAYPFLDALREWAGRQPSVTVHGNTRSMAGLMAAADLAIGAPGSATWERCVVGLPTVLVTLADNQVSIGRHLVAHGAAVSAGWHTQATEERIREILSDLSANPALVAATAAAAAAICDGQGAGRVAAALEDRA